MVLLYYQITAFLLILLQEIVLQGLLSMLESIRQNLLFPVI